LTCSTISSVLNSSSALGSSDKYSLYKLLLYLKRSSIVKLLPKPERKFARHFPIGSSSLINPSSNNCNTIVALNTFVMEAILNKVLGLLYSILVLPNPL